MPNENCDPMDFLDPRKASLQELYYLASRGNQKAQVIVEQYEKDIDLKLSQGTLGN